QAVKKAKTKQEKQQEIRLRLVRLLESKKSDLTSQWLAETRDEFDINYKMDHKTLLHEICSNDNSSFYLFLPVVVSMFSNEIDWTLTDANGKTPLLCAKEKQNQVVLEVLTHFGAHVSGDENKMDELDKYLSEDELQELKASMPNVSENKSKFHVL
ncbi:hypothetical protein RFI_36412, partial [Reticulomyxa filosa]